MHNLPDRPISPPPSTVPGSEGSERDKKTEKSSTDRMGRSVSIGTKKSVVSGATVSQTLRVPLEKATDSSSSASSSSASSGRSLSKSVTSQEAKKADQIFQSHSPVNAARQEKIETAKSSLMRQTTDTLSPGQLMDNLEQFNKALEGHLAKTEGELAQGSLFTNITSPERTRLAPNVHANWLDGSTQSFAGFMYPSMQTRAQALEAFMDKGITRHAHLANDFTVWLQHENTGPVFPMSSMAFKQLQEGERVLNTELGKVKVTYGEVSRDPATGQLFGSVTVSGDVKVTLYTGEEVSNSVTRTVQWPLDSLEIRPDLRLELASSTDHDTYVYKDSENQTLHTLEVDSILWKDFESVSPMELHRLASRLGEVSCASAGCRAGVGRTGTLFVATKMLQWAEEHPKEKLTNKQIMEFVTEGRVNRSEQVVQSESQMALLVRYKNYLNENPHLLLASSMKRLQQDLQVNDFPHIVRNGLNERLINKPVLLEILSDPARHLNAEDEVLLDEIYGLLADPISGEVFVDPVVTPYGHTYERAGIEQWLGISQKAFRGELGFSPHLQTTCPLTRNPLKLSDLKNDVFTQRLMSLLTQRAAAFAPATEAGEVKIKELEKLLTTEPLHWCRIVSAVMPQNSYIVRRKGLGGENDFVIEFRGSHKMQKCGFRVNAEGKFQPTMQLDKSFATIEELVHWLKAADKKNSSLKDAPTRFTNEQIKALNKTLGKEAFMANLNRDETLMSVVKHLEQLFVDKTPETMALLKKGQGGYVRAGISACSFPCFTYVTAKGPSRCCIKDGRLFGVAPLTLKAKSLDECEKLIDAMPGLSDEKIKDVKQLSDEQKLAFKKELHSVKDRLDFKTGTITLFRPTDKPMENIKLSSLTVEQVRRKAQNGYVVTMDFDDE